MIHRVMDGKKDMTEEDALHLIRYEQTACGWRGVYKLKDDQAGDYGN